MRLGWRGQAGRIRFQEIVVMTQSGAKMGKGLQESKGRIEEGLGGSLEKSLSSSPWASRRRCCKNFSWIRNLMSSCNPPRATVSFLFVCYPAKVTCPGVWGWGNADLLLSVK